MTGTLQQWVERLIEQLRRMTPKEKLEFCRSTGLEEQMLLHMLKREKALRIVEVLAEYWALDADSTLSPSALLFNDDETLLAHVREVMED